MTSGLKVLIIEDDQDDAFLFQEMLREAVADNAVVRRVVRLEEGMTEAAAGDYDIIVADLGLPDSQGLNTIRSLIAGTRRIPVVALTGLADSEAGLEAVSAGAQDYLVKGRISSELLIRAIRYAIERKKIENEKEDVILELRDALAKVKRLSGLLPICASCKNIRDDKGYWQQIESYISDHSSAEFSHGLCPDCAKKLYPEFYNRVFPEGK
jgi:CheY-like chemotaxis protein